MRATAREKLEIVPRSSPPWADTTGQAFRFRFPPSLFSFGRAGKARRVERGFGGKEFLPARAEKFFRNQFPDFR
ncbi:hypothetical protein B9J78_03420 [bacterium Unc6]|nr:hypothetical protein [bacterium Unc6]